MRGIREEDGFTLVETLVALFVFAILVSASTFVFGQTVEASERIEAGYEELQALQRTRAALRADLMQMAARVSRDEAGNPRPVLAGGRGSDVLLGFVRRGPDNRDRAGRPSMQYVEWRASAAGLERRAAPFVDGAAPGDPATMLGGIESARIEFHVDGRWQDSPQGPRPDVFANAVRLAFDHPRFGKVEQLFLTGLAT